MLPPDTEGDLEPWQMHFEWAQNADKRGVPWNMGEYQKQLGVGFPTRVIGSTHNLVWEPGWPGKGFFHKGELTTWGTNSNMATLGWPHHVHMWEQKYPGTSMVEALNHDPNTMFINIEPDGKLREAHPFKGDWDSTIAQIHAIEPRFKQAQEADTWENMFK